MSRINYEGYAGGPGGRAFADGDIPDEQFVSAIRVKHGDYIDSLQLLFQSTSGATVESEKHGGWGGANDDLFYISGAVGEFLVGIEGRCGDVVDSLVFITNIGRRSPKYGGNGGANAYAFSVPSPGQIVGFAGRAGDYIDQIGVAYRY